jgi:hypothetical protein
MQAGGNIMSDKNQYYGLDNFAHVMETVIQNDVDILIEAEQAPAKPSLFKRLMNTARHNRSPIADNIASQTSENAVASPYPAQ